MLINLQKDNGGIVMINFYACHITVCSSKKATVEGVAGKIGEFGHYRSIWDIKLT